MKALFLAGSPSEIGGRSVEGSDSTDGRRFRLSGGASVLVRMSGTEPLARIYLESGTEQDLDTLEHSIRSML
jgi:phosphoglucomutase